MKQKHQVDVDIPEKPTQKAESEIQLKRKAGLKKYRGKGHLLCFVKKEKIIEKKERTAQKKGRLEKKIGS